MCSIELIRSSSVGTGSSQRDLRGMDVPINSLVFVEHLPGDCEQLQEYSSNLRTFDSHGMKIILCNGRVMTVYDARPIMTLHEGITPIKAHGAHVLSDDAAREMVKRVMREGATKKSIKDTL
jgi:hypothetical protein